MVHSAIKQYWMQDGLVGLVILNHFTYNLKCRMTLAVAAAAMATTAIDLGVLLIGMAAMMDGAGY
jgi:hypothetical protein